MKVKVCGVFDSENFIEVLSLSPDYIGFNFYPQSKRFCRFDKLPDIELKDTKLVGVFVNDKLSTIIDKTSKYQLSLIQLHGDEKPELLRTIKSELPSVEVIKAIGVEDSSDFLGIERWSECADYLLFDKKAISYGGTGTKFSWDLLDQIVVNKNFFLAGGLSVEDARPVRSLCRVFKNLYGVDVNSRFEDSSGKKNIELLRRFIEEVKS